MFYSVLPNWKYPKPQFDRIARFAPLIGLIIGGFQASLWILLSYLNWNVISISLCVIAFEIWLTGGLHLDGLIDTADGLGAPKDKCLEAMKDSRVGASGVLALTIILLMQIASLIKLGSFAPFALLISNFWARCSPIWAISKFPYLHKVKTNSLHHQFWQGWKEAKPALLVIAITLLVFILLPRPIHGLNKYQLFSSLLIGIIPAIYIPDNLGKRLNGHSGDSYGASVVLVETCLLLILAFIL